MNKESFSFIVWLIHELAEAWHASPPRVYDLLKKSGCLSDYLIRHFDVLHTMGSKALIADVEEYLAVRGYSR